MIKVLTEKYRKHIAWSLLLIFYGELAVTVHATKGYGNIYSPMLRTHPVKKDSFFFYPEKKTGRTDLFGDFIKKITKPGTAKLSTPAKKEVEEKTYIGGPGQPEMNSFQSVGADNMVNLFSGDFSYNIPLLDVGGYPVNIFYSGGSTMEQEASWVGLGWNINPGTINRNMRGLPDDYNGQDKITKVQSMTPDLTVGVTGSLGLELVGVPGLSADLSAGIFYNNRRGLGMEAGLRGEFSAQKMLTGKGKDEKTLMDTVPTLSLSAGVNLNSQQGMTLNGGFSVYRYNQEKQTRLGLSTSIGYSSRQGLTDLSISGEYSNYQVYNRKNNTNGTAYSNIASHSTNISFARSSFTPTIRMPLTNLNQYYAVKLGGETTVLFWNGTIAGYVQESKIAKHDRTQVKPAYGYMYYEKATDDKNALMDFNRLNDGVYTHKTPVISAPAYTYDVFTINGEGTGGSFRGYRGNMGYIRDNVTKSKSGSLNLTLDVGSGFIFHGGTVIGGVYSPAEVGEWKNSNTLRRVAAANGSDGIYQGFYFRNPGEKAIIDEDYYKQMGADKLVRPYLLNNDKVTPTLASGFQVFGADMKKEEIPISLSAVNGRRNKRDKRAQVITYLTAGDASKIGLDKDIYSYPENTFTPGSCPAARVKIPRYDDPKNPFLYRREHHISQVNVLEPDGRRYIYGVPVYQIKQKEVTYGTNTEAPGENGLITIANGENTPEGAKGRDGFYQSEEMEGYATSYLLSGILSPDYVDVTDDGVSDDDLGTAIKFNYSRINRQVTGTDQYWPHFKWRMPVSGASFNEGLKTDKKDNKGLYTYGEKELWYLHSVESKNMVATFTTSNRNDGRGVEEGGAVSSSIQVQKKLDRIDLYTKADYLKDPTKAKPVKTVHFQYGYQLCGSYPLNSVNGAGKLTLQSIWFSYNGNYKQKLNKYKFQYSATNPSYNPAENDRWGNYKLHTENNDDVRNADFPYTIQTAQDPDAQIKNNQWASAWNLNQILLPGGAAIEIDYEADDYAYVQNKRACEMTKIAGFGMSATEANPSDKLYTWDKDKVKLKQFGKMDHRFVFFNVPAPLSGKDDISRKYLQGFKQLLLKLWVKMPSDNNGSGYEPINIYSIIKDYGIAKDQNGNNNPNRFYIELEETKNDGSPVMQTIMQFLKDFLPSKAYPGYDVKGETGLVQLVRATQGMADGFIKGVLGFEGEVKGRGVAKEVKLTMSFARLNNPSHKKIGGGYRVKQIKIRDNWDKMTLKGQAAGLSQSFYGQIYDYTTTEEINGAQVTISSGVASYEPGIGNEENPFREVVKYSEKQFLGPTDHNNIELPVAETFFPSPSIGYSKVTVRSIHSKNNANSNDNKKIKSGIGLQQTEFYTTRDFPVISDYTSFDNESRLHHKPSALNKIFNFNKRDFLTLTQGFRVVLNDMNGKMKSQTSFPENDLKSPVNHTAWYYRLTAKGSDKYLLDNTVPVIDGPEGKISNKIVGRDVEVMNDFREHYTYTYSAQVPLNGEFFTVGPFPVFIPTLFRMAFRDESMFRSATTMKVVNEYGILDSVVNIDKGSVVGTKNMVYDAETGDVLVSRTNNEFDKPVFQFSYPAWWANSGMEPAYKNVDLVYKNVLFRNGKIESSHVNMDYFESGDEVYVDDRNFIGPPETAGCITGGYPATLPQSDVAMVWAVDLRKDLRNTEKEFIFLDRFGNPYNSVGATIRIIRSGKRNLASASVGNIVSADNPIRQVIESGQPVERIVLDNQTKIITSGSAEFKERWRANDQFYSKDESIVTVRQAQEQSSEINVLHSYTRKRNQRSEDKITSYEDPLVDKVFEIEKDRNRVKGQNLADRDRMWYDTKSWVQMSLPSILSDAIVTKANLSLPAHRVNHSGMYFPTGQHSSSDPHYNFGNGHAQPMTFTLTRMKTPWYPPANSNDWKRIFEDNYNYNSDPVLFTPPNVPIGVSNRNYEVTVTNLVKSMVANMGNATIDNGIKISFTQGSDKISGQKDGPWRYCFNPFSVNSNVKEGTGYLEGMKLKIHFYKCSPTNTVVYQGLVDGAPVTPPAGYYYCRETEIVKVCYSVFSKKQMNPYIEGILGNWRAWRSYVYYGERREDDPLSGTTINKNGFIKDFEAFWTLAQTPADPLGKTGSLKWVWNSEITQYNRKGAELENRDPLGRYNAGIYGYQESLPVAVINNSRLRLSAFDGFEDYAYKDDPCEPYCKPSKRHFTTGVIESMLATEAHTGMYSVKVNPNTNVGIDVTSGADDTVVEPDIRIKINNTPYSQVTSVKPNGRGLKASFYNNTTFSGSPVFTGTMAQVDLYMRSQKNSNWCIYSNLPSANVQCNEISVRWTGKVQVQVTGEYKFVLPKEVDDEAFVYINNVQVASAVLNVSSSSSAVNLTAGTLYDIRVDFRQTKKTYGKIQLFWIRPLAIVPTSVPSINLYPEGMESLADNSVQTQTVYCLKPDTIQAINHHLIDSFRVIPGKKMVMSVWVKKGEPNCSSASYSNISIQVKNESNGIVSTLQPKEQIIEGWQQFETIFTVPESGNKIKLQFNGDATYPVYFDDLRLHPFNANMKSFVYDPVTLRLAAELDENNFASMYEYDDDGTLVRVKKETRQGIKTISETRSALNKLEL